MCSSDLLTRFNLVFPEKRDFFLEGKGIYQFGHGTVGQGASLTGTSSTLPELFFTRQIGLNAGRILPILGGGRLTGRVGRFTLGAMNIATDADAVSKIKPGAYLISTARGPICDTGALLEGLKSNRLLAVGLDVLPSEPATLDDPLVKAWQANEPWLRGRVLMGPHSGFYSPDSLVDLRTKAAQTACWYLKDNKLVNCVNAEFLKKPR